MKRTPHRSGGAALVAVPEFLAGQIGVIGPGVAALMLGGAVYAVGKGGRRDANRPALKLLVAVGGTFWLLTFADSFRSKVQVNWTAPAYFTLTILAAYFTAVVANDPDGGRAWRNWFCAALIFGIVMLPITHDFAMLYPAITAINAHLHKPIAASKIDRPSSSAVGTSSGKRWATRCSRCRQEHSSSATIISRPRRRRSTRPVSRSRSVRGSYFANPKRHTQIPTSGPNRQLDPSSPLVVRDAIYVMAALADVTVGRRIYSHINNTNPVLVDGSPERRAVEAAGWEIAFDGMEIVL